MIYVCSDIHGRWNRYEQAINKIKEDDTLYILGDIIDRHPDGIRIMLDVINRKNVEFIVGNHEIMMYEAMFKGIMSTKRIWCYENNGGKETINDFLDLSEEDKLKIKEFIENSYVFKRIEVNGKTYHLSHAGMMEENESLKELKMNKADYNDIDEYVWITIFEKYIEELNENECYIVGHKFVQNYHWDYQIFKHKNIIDIDGGCAIPDNLLKSALILYCIDTDKAEYIF